jgi:hypothetical protein
MLNEVCGCAGASEGRADAAATAIRRCRDMQTTFMQKLDLAGSPQMNFTLTSLSPWLATCEANLL